MKKIKAKYAFGGEVRTDGPNPEGVDPYALATGVLASAAPKDVDGTNGFKYATMGASLAAINPVVGAVGAAVGLGADLIAGGRAKKDAASEQSLLNKANFQKLHGESGLLNPYAQPGGFKQTFGMKNGGPVDPPKKKAWENSINFNSRYGSLSREQKADSAYVREKYMDPSHRFSQGESLAGTPRHASLSRSQEGSYKGYQSAIGFLENENPMQLSNDQVVKLALSGKIPFGLTKIDQERIRSINPKSQPVDKWSDPGIMRDIRGYADGGTLPSGHVIPAEQSRQAIDDAARAGINITGPVTQGEREGGVIPGAGHPRADDKVFQPAGADPIKVSSGEVYVNDDIFQRMAKALGMGVAEYQRRMYPQAENGSGYQDGGQIPPGSSDPRTAGMAKDAVWNPEYAKAYETYKRLSGYVMGSKSTLNAGPQKEYNEAVATLKRLSHRDVSDFSNLPAPNTGIPPPVRTPAEKPLLPGLGGPGYVPPVRTNTTSPVVSAVTKPSLASASPKSTPAQTVQPTEELELSAPASYPYTGPGFSLEAEPVGPRADGTGLADPVAKAATPGSSAASPYSYNPAATTQAIANANPGLQSSPGSGEGPKAGTDLNTLNNTATAINAAGSLISLGWNAFSRRTPGIRPPMLELQPIDLKTDAFAADLDADRANARANALYGSVNKQGFAREAAINVNDIESRRKNASAVEDRENTERTINNQIENQERQYNNEQTSSYLQREVEANNNFKFQKGQAFSQSLGALSATIGGHMNNKVQIGAMQEANDFGSRYLKYRSGSDDSMFWTPGDVFMDGRRFGRVKTSFGSGYNRPGMMSPTP